MDLCHIVWGFVVAQLSAGGPLLRTEGNQITNSFITQVKRSYVLLTKKLLQNPLDTSFSCMHACMCSCIL